MNSKFNNTQKEVEEAKERHRTSRETLGKFFYDLAKTTFAVMVVGNMATAFGFGKVSLMTALSLILGTSLTWAFAKIGNDILKK